MEQLDTPPTPYNPFLIEKEHIPDLIFPKEEVLQEAEAIRERNARLYKSMRMGNTERRKVKIIFKDVEGLKQVETTVWATTERSVVLKKGTVIPIHRILEVKFY